jgi:hypothetical protein
LNVGDGAGHFQILLNLATTILPQFRTILSRCR